MATEKDTKPRGRPRKIPPPASTSVEIPPEALRGVLEAVLAEQFQLLAARQDEQILGLRGEIASLEKRIPDPQAVIDQAVAVLRPGISKQINDKLDGYGSGGANGHRAVEETPSAALDTPKSLSAKATELTDVVGAVADVLIKTLMPVLFDFKKEARLDRQEARYDKLIDTNPVAIRDALLAQNSPMLPLWMNTFAPPTQLQVESQQKERSETYLAGLRTAANARQIRREEAEAEARWLRRETPSSNLPASSGSPTNASPSGPTGSSATKPGGVSMNWEPTRTGDKPKLGLSLREVMG